ncbi:hypothetical protein L198_06146 [Cryptococcus wingfieldii CBS 7118]|uniref:Uncharacterized protein n=1 Tax=Cryptococcus wingfieldii CBS 7118 TaxID=1295528 RepID=A0A1E3IQF8_9TREE|nr:hypothetical protein L198_06146 [Cryptococcus wingfieldii CBS 7118]ODN90829.1 hypothetical protein L198_06146 [Cryptococcus wingfieldii CBS 7118]
MSDEERLQQEARQVLQTITAVLFREEGEFQGILDRFMDAAGPQGSVPANDTVIEGLKGLRSMISHCLRANSKSVLCAKTTSKWMMRLSEYLASILSMTIVSYLG